VNSPVIVRPTSANFSAPPSSIDNAQDVIDNGPPARTSVVEIATCPPEVTTSSTTKTRRPSISAPSARRRVP
jgi:hypothetical protein